MTTGLGIVTYKRPDRYFDLLQSLFDHAQIHVEYFWAHIDGSPEGYEAVRELVPTSCDNENLGVAHAKNVCLTELMAAGCDWIILSEDDVLVDSPDAVLGYLKAAKDSGQRHLNFHAHGPANRLPLATRGPVTYWPHFVGAWSLYKTGDLEAVGLMDEQMVNAFEHIEHTARLMRHGACRRWPGVADATGSEYWLHEQPGAIEETTIPLDTRFERQRKAILHWREKDEETLRMVFPKETTWEQTGG